MQFDQDSSRAHVFIPWRPFRLAPVCPCGSGCFCVAGRQLINYTWARCAQPLKTSLLLHCNATWVPPYKSSLPPELIPFCYLHCTPSLSWVPSSLPCQKLSVPCQVSCIASSLHSRLICTNFFGMSVFFVVKFYDSMNLFVEFCKFFHTVLLLSGWGTHLHWEPSKYCRRSCISFKVPPLTLPGSVMAAVEYPDQGHTCHSPVWRLWWK